MNHIWFDILRRFGQPVRLRRDGLWSDSSAFLQPLRDRQEALPGCVSELGWTDARRWLYLGRDVLRENAVLEWNGLRFRAVSGRAVFFGKDLCYWRAVLEPEREALA